MSVAIVHYWLTGMRGDERFLEALLDLYSEADIFTHVYVPEAVSVRTPFINRPPWAPRWYRPYLPLMPLALKALDLTGYDLIISSESRPAKGVLAPAPALHVCYCHSPMCYVWDFYQRYRREAVWFSRLAMPLCCRYLQLWDVTSAANSANVAGRGFRHPGPVPSVLAIMALDVAVLLLCLTLAWAPALYLLLAVLTKVYTPLQTPPEIIKRQSGAIFFFFLVVALFFFMSHEATACSRAIFLVSWGLPLVALPVVRGCAFHYVPGIFSWRAPCELISAGVQARLVSLRLEEPGSCLKLTAGSVPSDEAAGFAVPNYSFEALPAFAAANPHAHAVLLVNPCADWPPPDAMEHLRFPFAPSCCKRRRSTRSRPGRGEYVWEASPWM